MNNPITISRISAEEVPQATQLLAATFNVSAARLSKGMPEFLAGQGYNPNTGEIVQAAMFTAKLNDRVVGVVSVTTDADHLAKGEAYISNLAVDTTAGQGLSLDLMKYAESYISQQWLNKGTGSFVVVDDTKIKDPGSRFYEDQGYAAKGTSGKGNPLLFKPVK